MKRSTEEFEAEVELYRCQYASQRQLMTYLYRQISEDWEMIKTLEKRVHNQRIELRRLNGEEKT